MIPWIPFEVWSQWAEAKKTRKALIAKRITLKKQKLKSDTKRRIIGLICVSPLFFSFVCFAPLSAVHYNPVMLVVLVNGHKLHDKHICFLFIFFIVHDKWEENVVDFNNITCYYGVHSWSKGQIYLRTWKLSG